MKTHIAFISLIVAVIFLIWKMMDVAPEEKQPLVISGYAIEIVRASYGLECARYAASLNSSSYADSQDNVIIRENNVLTDVSNRCNGQVKCILSSNVKDYAGMVSCAGASLQVEYRCFMLDRLRKAKAQMDPAVIDCSNI